MEVLDDVCQQVGALPATPGHLVAQLGEVDVQVVVGRLVVQVDPQLAGWKLVALQDGFLSATRRGGSVTVARNSGVFTVSLPVFTGQPTCPFL